jgi:hypothetical protein
VERVEVRIRLEETFLQNVLGILVVLGDMLRQRVDLALVLADELAES